MQTEYRHADMSDRGPDLAKTMILEGHKFLDDDTTLTPIKRPVAEMIEPDPVPEITEPGLVAHASGHH